MAFDDFQNITDKELRRIMEVSDPGGPRWSGANAELQIRQLESLKKPHRPSFWLLIISVTLAFVAAVASILALPQMQKVVFGNPQFQEKTEQLQPSEHKSQPQKPDTPKK
jgi:hypothetical protein